MSAMQKSTVPHVQYQQSVNRQEQMMRGILNALRSQPPQHAMSMKDLQIRLQAGEDERLGTGTRTIRRLICVLKKQGAEIKYERPMVCRPGGYRLLNRGWSPYVYSRASESHLEAFAFAARLFEDSLPPMMHESLKDFEICVNGDANGGENMVDHPATRALISTAGCNVVIDPVVAGAVIEAWRNCRPLIVAYNGKECTLEPHALFYTEGAWYVRGRQAAPAVDPAWRSYGLHRMGFPARLAPGTFTRDEKVLAEIRAGKLFDYRTVKDVEILCRRKTQEARFVSERRYFPGQTLTPNSNGSVTMRIPEVAIDHVVSWVLAFGQNVEVVKPSDLRAKVREACEKMLALHKD